MDGDGPALLRHRGLRKGGGRLRPGAKSPGRAGDLRPERQDEEGASRRHGPAMEHGRGVVSLCRAVQGSGRRVREGEPDCPESRPAQLSTRPDRRPHGQAAAGPRQAPGLLRCPAGGRADGGGVPGGDRGVAFGAVAGAGSGRGGGMYKGRCHRKPGAGRPRAGRPRHRGGKRSGRALFPFGRGAQGPAPRGRSAPAAGGPAGGRSREPVPGHHPGGRVRQGEAGGSSRGDLPRVDGAVAFHRGVPRAGRESTGRTGATTTCSTCSARRSPT